MNRDTKYRLIALCGAALAVPSGATSMCIAVFPVRRTGDVNSLTLWGGPTEKAPAGTVRDLVDKSQVGIFVVSASDRSAYDQNDVMDAIMAMPRDDPPGAMLADALCRVGQPTARDYLEASGDTILRGRGRLINSMVWHRLEEDVRTGPALELMVMRQNGAATRTRYHVPTDHQGATTRLAMELGEVMRRTLLGNMDLYFEPESCLFREWTNSYARNDILLSTSGPDACDMSWFLDYEDKGILDPESPDYALAQGRSPEDFPEGSVRRALAGMCARSEAQGIPVRTIIADVLSVIRGG